MLTGEGYEALYGGAGAGEAFHGGDGVALALEAYLCSDAPAWFEHPWFL